MNLSDLTDRAERSFVKDITSLCGRESVVAGDVYSDEAHRMLFHAAASVLPLTDEDVAEIVYANPCVLQAPSPAWVFDDLDMEDTPTNEIRAQILYEVWNGLAIFYEAMQLASDERLIVVVVGRGGLRLVGDSLPDELFRTQLLA